MTTAERVTSDKEGMVLACPGCDQAGDIHRRNGGANVHVGDPDDPLACGNCSTSFEEPVERERRTTSGGTNAKCEDLTLEDVGLEG